MMIKTYMLTAATLLMISTSVIAADKGSILGEVRDRAVGQTTAEGNTATKPATGTKLNAQPANTESIDGAAAQHKIDNQPNTNEQPAAGQHRDDEHRGRGRHGRHGDDSHRGHGKHGKDKHAHSRGKKEKHKGHDHDKSKNRSRHDDDHHDDKDRGKHEEDHDQDDHD